MLIFYILFIPKALKFLSIRYISISHKADLKTKYVHNPLKKYSKCELKHRRAYLLGNKSKEFQKQ